MVLDAYNLYCLNNARKACSQQEQEYDKKFQELVEHDGLIACYDAASGKIDFTQEGGEIIFQRASAAVDAENAATDMKSTVFVMFVKACMGSWAGYKLYHS